MIPQAEGNQCRPSIYNLLQPTMLISPQSLTESTREVVPAPGCAVMLLFWRSEPDVSVPSRHFTVLPCCLASSSVKRGLEKVRRTDRPTDRLTVSNRSRSRFSPDATRRRWTKSGVRVQVFRVRRWRRCRRPHRKRLPRADSLRVTR